MPPAAREIVEAGWASALQPVADADRRDGRLPARRDRRRPDLPARRAERPARVQAAVRRRPGADRRPGPVPDARASGRAVASRSSPTCARCRGQPAEHLPRTAGRPRPADAVQRRPDAVVGAGRAAAQPGAHRRARRARRRTAARAGRSVTEQAIRALVARGTPLVAILWGRDAQSLAPLLGPGAARSSRRTRRRCRPTAASSARGRSAGPTPHHPLIQTVL